MIPQARLVRIAIFDVDGVLSDGGLHYAENGDAMKTFDVRDGMGMKLLQDSGVELAIITSRRAGSGMLWSTARLKSSMWRKPHCFLGHVSTVIVRPLRSAIAKALAAIASSCIICACIFCISC